MHCVVKIFLWTVAFACMGIVACGDDDSSSSAPMGGESSSVIVEESSSSIELSSSSSVLENLSSSTIDLSESTEKVAAKEITEISTTVIEDTLDLFYYGCMNLNFKADSFLTIFERGDLVTLMVDGYDTLDVPVVGYRGDVSVGEYLLSVGDATGFVTLEVLNGDPAEAIGIGRDVKFPINVTVKMKEKGGYVKYLEMRQHLTMSYYLESYPTLSIEEFANFRKVNTTGMGEGVLYRSSSPIDASLGRNLYADSLAKVAGVATFVDFAEVMETAMTYRDFADSYYATQNTIFLGVPPAFVNKVFKDALVRGYRFMIEHEGPYLLHCTYGMDRTGFSIAVLEALMGATAAEIKADYAKTFINYCSVVDNVQVALTQDQVDLLKDIIAMNLRNSYHTVGVDISDFDNVDLAAATEKYLVALGMDQAEVDALKNRLK
ncbi:tyrosine-protein phosphatase [uncultured Fibrobacter sp.]|uniref:tyrosine-protein phosphatase n=1 Tax=uncultured Fibrobacter sp. TaxID=261512 RepID=UPI0025F6607F|nr:tyrosine-protein phosphatase [uncultured Fibrobacter sp.]